MVLKLDFVVCLHLDLGNQEVRLANNTGTGNESFLTTKIVHYLSSSLAKVALSSNLYTVFSVFVGTMCEKKL